MTNTPDTLREIDLVQQSPQKDGVGHALGTVTECSPGLWKADYTAIKLFCERRLEIAAANGNKRAAVAWAKLEHVAFRCSLDAAPRRQEIPVTVADDEEDDWERLLDLLWDGSIDADKFRRDATAAGHSPADIVNALASKGDAA